MTKHLRLILDVNERLFFYGLVLLYLYAVLSTTNVAAAGLSSLCTTFDNAGGRIMLYEGQSNNVTIYVRKSECDNPACVAAKTSCSVYCNGCGGFNDFVNMTLTGRRADGSMIPGFGCMIARENGEFGFWLATCRPTNSLAGQFGYTLVLTVMNEDNRVYTTKSANIAFIAGDVAIQNCFGTFEDGTDKAYLDSDNVFQIWLKDNWNNSVGANTYRFGITPIPFTITVTWNPDNGTNVSLQQTPTVDTSGDNGFYIAIINPITVGNYLVKVGVDDTMILNSPIAFHVIKATWCASKVIKGDL